jgi:hypothetical protein
MKFNEILSVMTAAIKNYDSNTNMNAYVNNNAHTYTHPTLYGINTVNKYYHHISTITINTGIKVTNINELPTPHDTHTTHCRVQNRVNSGGTGDVLSGTEHRRADRDL